MDRGDRSAHAMPKRPLPACLPGGAWQDCNSQGGCQGNFRREQHKGATQNCPVGAKISFMPGGARRALRERKAVRGRAYELNFSDRRLAG